MRTIPHITMNDGRHIPTLGVGTFKLEPDAVRKLLPQAFDLGYRHVDTAEFYRNEDAVGEVVRTSGVPRDEVFVTSKVWNDHQDDARAALEASLERMGLDYLDLYLIHWPTPKRGLFPAVWDALIAAREDGLVRSIGVSNFLPSHLDALTGSGVVPAVNQVEVHPSFTCDDLLADNAARGIVVESWGPIGRGADLALPAVLEVAAECGATPSQVVLGWHLARGCVVFPKSSQMGRLHENLGALDVALSDDQIARISACDAGNRLGFHPDELN